MAKKIILLLVFSMCFAIISETHSQRVVYDLYITIEPVNAGTVEKYPDKYQYDDGEQVTLTAVQNSCWVFSGWDVNGTTYDKNPLSIVISSNTDVTAYFEEYIYCVDQIEEAVAAEDVACWAACLEYLTTTFKNIWYPECEFGEFALKIGMTCSDITPTSIQCCMGDYCRGCAISGQELIETMNKAGFNSGLGVSIDPALSKDGIETWVCDGASCISDILIFIIALYEGDPDHALVINGWDEYTSNVFFMDPYYGEHDNVEYAEFCALYGTGWVGSMLVSSWYPTIEFQTNVAVANIGDFYVSEGVDPCSPEMHFRINYFNNSPFEQAYVYVSDNEAGPCRVIESLVGVPNIGLEGNTWIDSWRYPYRDRYYYYYVMIIVVVSIRYRMTW